MGAGRLNGKASFNSAILPGENHAYPEATWPEREQIIQRHENSALAPIWFFGIMHFTDVGLKSTAILCVRMTGR